MVFTIECGEMQARESCLTLSQKKSVDMGKIILLTPPEILVGASAWEFDRSEDGDISLQTVVVRYIIEKVRDILQKRYHFYLDLRI